MRDDEDGAAHASDEALEQGEPGEVEVVRRLVEQEDVEAREEDPRQRRSRGLAAGERLERLVERLGPEPHLREDGGGPRGEVVAAEGEEAVERLGRGRGELRLLLEAGRELVELRLGLGHAGALREVAAQRLTRRGLVLLREVADGERGRRAADAARVRLLEPGQDPEERRLADPVRADEADSAPRGERQRHAAQDELGPVVLGDLDGGERADGRPPDGRDGRGARRGRRGARA